MKRILSLTAILLVVASLCLALVACSGNKTDESGFVYTLDKETNTYSVTGYTGTATDIEIPAKYDTLLVSSISANAFKDNKTVKKITIPAGIKSIGSNAFYGCTELAEVVFAEGSSITEIATGTFSGCSKLSNMVIPATVKTIGYKAFNNCTSMKTVSFPSSLEVIDYYAFSGCTSLYDIVDFDKTKNFKVYANAFSQCDSLEVLMTPEVIADNEKTAVYTYSNGMLSTEVEGGIKLIKWLKPASSELEGEGKVTIPANIIEIHPQAFTGREDITRFEVAEGNTKYSADNGILYNKDKTKLVAYPFGMESESYKIADGVKEIGAYAFYGNENINTIELSASVEAIGESAFEKSKLVHLLSNDSMVKVGSNAFYTIKVDNKLVFESYKYFARDTEYLINGQVLFSEDETKLVCYSSELKDTEYVIPKTVTSITSGAFCTNTSLANIDVEEGNVNFFAKEGILYEGKDDIAEKLYAVPVANTEGVKNGEYKLPDSVIGLASCAFSGNKNVTKVTLNKKCTAIPSHMFFECEALVSLIIPANELDIGADAVTGTALTYVEFGGNDIAWNRAVKNATDSDKEVLENEKLELVLIKD